MLSKLFLLVAQIARGLHYSYLIQLQSGTFTSVSSHFITPDPVGRLIDLNGRFGHGRRPVDTVQETLVGGRVAAVSTARRQEPAATSAFSLV
jgi:hypothetical protein